MYLSTVYDVCARFPALQVLTTPTGIALCASTTALHLLTPHQVQASYAEKVFREINVKN